MFITFLLLLVGIALTYYCHIKKRELDPTLLWNKHSTAGYVLAKNTHSFIVPFTAVAALYFFLSILIYLVDQDSTTIERLRFFEETISRVLDWLKLLKLSSWQAFGMLLFLFCLALAGVYLDDAPVDKEGFLRRFAVKGSSLFKRYSKVISTAYGIIILACSFTFFSNQLQPLVGNLDLRIKKAEEAIGKLANVFQKELNRAVVNEVLANAPDSVKANTQQFNTAYDFNHQLEVEYYQAKFRYGFENLEIEKLLEKNRKRYGSVEKVVLHTEKQYEQREGATPKKPLEVNEMDITVENLEQLDDVLEKEKWDTEKRAQTIVEMNERKRVTEKLIENILDKPKDLLEPIKESYPFLGAIIDIATKTLDDLTNEWAEKHLIRPVLDKILRTCAAGDCRGTSSVRSSAEDIVKREAKIQQQWQEQLKYNAVKLERELVALKDSEKELQNKRQNLSRLVGEAKIKLEAEKADILTELRSQWFSTPFEKPIQPLTASHGAIADGIKKLEAEDLSLNFLRRYEANNAKQKFDLKRLLRLNVIGKDSVLPQESTNQKNQQSAVSQINRTTARYDMLGNLYHALARYESEEVSIAAIKTLREIKSMSDNNEYSDLTLKRIDDIVDRGPIRIDSNDNYLNSQSSRNPIGKTKVRGFPEPGTLNEPGARSGPWKGIIRLHR